MQSTSRAIARGNAILVPDPTTGIKVMYKRGTDKKVWSYWEHKMNSIKDPEVSQESDGGVEKQTPEEVKD